MNEQFDFIEVDWNKHVKDIQAIRRTVFIEEQGVPEAEEWDELDADASTTHFLAFDQNNKACGTIRLVPRNGDYQVTRLAVLKDYRGRGLASALVRKACQLALSSNIERMYLHAQVKAEKLYTKLGFSRVSDIFFDAGIEHVEMVFNKNSSEALRAVFSKQVVRLSYPHDFLQHALNIIGASSRQLDICSKNLRDDIFCKEEFVRAISSFARSDRHAQVRILVYSTKKLSRRSQNLIELARRLSSKIQIRSLTSECDEAPPGFVCSDSDKLVYFNNEEQLEGFCCYQAGPESESLLDQFNHAWHHLSVADPDLAALSL